ncbi:isochorismate synthase [Nocardia sp. CDC159]|uniref:isochorismate synthase n=1 Tax=Nocardia pulmonis TaxID=2951408 RepID=A0A9X2EAQ2_9NOCA|nr:MULTISPECIES: isochorismate synthase [Nocardia]MCM6777447.1 isochorismate synthase [Nocardia pulmonis]MCM6790446.1 isochorismate synthase [Nocardia sp. CDC159]
MDGFLLAQPGGVLRASGVRRALDDAGRAAAALREGAELVVGALPFDPRDPAALCVPERAEHTAGPWRPAALPALPPVRVVTEIPSPAEHVARVTKLVEQLSDPGQPLRKVVAARSLLAAADEPLDPTVVAAHLLTRHPQANVFAVDLTPAGRSGATLVGATPEVLVARHGEIVTLRPLAGTAPRHADPERDARRSRELLASAKNRCEHAFVIDWIRERLAPVCAELTVPGEPELINTAEVWHLATPIRGRLRDPRTTALDLAVLLHPTPAVCGTPTDLALETITELEEERGFYGGAVGWCDARGDGEWVVAIRCAELSADGRTVRAFGGGGIVAASDPQAELDETTAKLRTLLGGLRCALPEF